MPIPPPQQARRGRPRPAETIERDETVFALLADGPRTRNQLAETLGLERSVVYLSLDRLHRAGRIAQCAHRGGIAWVQAGADCQ